MVKKTAKYSGITFAILAIFSLSLPLFSTYITDGETCDIVIKGYNLVEFSPWGGIVLLAPLVLLGLMLSKLRNSIKTVGLIVLFTSNCLALCGSSSAAYKWITETSYGFAETHLSHLIYALLFLAATVCFWISCNFSSDIKSLKSFFHKNGKIKVKPVDHHKEKFFWCHRPYDFVKYKENGEMIMGENILCFATGEGYFAGLSDGDMEEYFNIEALDDNEAVAFVMGTMSTGIYGSFYEGQDFLNAPDMMVNICPFDKINFGEAKLRIPNKNGDFICSDIIVFPYSTDNIRAITINEDKEFSAKGAAVIQDGELIAFVTEYNAEKREYKCVPAELMAVDLCRKIYEQRVFEAMRECEEDKRNKLHRYAFISETQNP